MAGKSHLSAIPSADIFATGGFTVDPGDAFSALTVPERRIFVLTDVIMFPVVEKNDPDFVVRYRIEEHPPGAPIGTGSKFQYNTVGTHADWSQHFTSGIKFAGGTTVTVVNTSFTTSRSGFQLLGYFTDA
jgi:hypothetical protein